MRRVALPPLGRDVGRLGFGCASVMGRAGRQASLRALGAAHDAGVDYLDVARSYGYGRAEGVVGEFVRGRRDRFVIATKAGIAPALPGVVSRLALPVARAVAARVPGLQRVVSRRGERLSGVSSGRFEADQVGSSLETSLRELGTDHVDLLLLHDVDPAAYRDERLLRTLDDAVRAGKVRAFGVATGIAETVEILSDPRAPAVVQIANRIDRPDLERLPAPRPFAVTHSPLSIDAASRASLSTWLGRNAARMRALGLPGDALPPLLLAWAVAANPDGVVLCGMVSEAHVAANVLGASQGAMHADALRSLGAEWREC